MNGTGIEKHVFISHRSLEKARADEIQKFLEQNGIRCWKAPESLHKRGSQDYNADIFDAIRKCGCLLFLLSNQAPMRTTVNGQSRCDLLVPLFGSRLMSCSYPH